VKLQIMQIREEYLTNTLSELRDVETKIAELRELGGRGLTAEATRSRMPFEKSDD
jgi:hypothetical protein